MRKRQIIRRAALAYFAVALPMLALFFLAAWRGVIEVAAFASLVGFWGSILTAVVVAIRELRRYRRWLEHAPRRA